MFKQAYQKLPDGIIDKKRLTNRSGHSIVNIYIWYE